MKRKRTSVPLVLGGSPDSADYDEVLDAPVRVVEETTGKSILVCVRIPEAGELHRVLPVLEFPTIKRTGGLPTRSKTFGWMPRNPLRNDYCRRAMLDDPRDRVASIMLERLTPKIDALYREYEPATYEEHRKSAATVNPEQRLGDTVFTSMYVNDTYAIGWHRDTGNFTGVYSCMVAIRRNTEGGMLVLPEYRIALKVSDCTLTMFDGQKAIHGVTDIKKITSSGYRMTTVFYSAKQLWKCHGGEKDERRAASERRRIVEQQSLHAS